MEQEEIVVSSQTITNENLIPPLILIRQPNGESLPKKMRPEEARQDIPTPPLSVPSTSPLPVDQPPRTTSSNSDTSTIPLNRPFSPLLNSVCAATQPSTSTEILVHNDSQR